MPAAITDLLVKQGDGTQPIPTQLTAEKAVGASTASLAAATGWDTTTAKHVRMYKTTVVSGQTIPDQSTISFYKATLSGTTLSNLTLIWSATGTDQKYDAGDTVDLALTSGWLDDLATHILTEHNQDGTHNIGWTTWTPTLTNISGHTVEYARYTKIGKTVHFMMKLVLTGTNISGNVYFTRPVAMASVYGASGANAPIGDVLMLDSSAGTIYKGHLRANNSTFIFIVPEISSTSYTTGGTISSTVPFTWATSDEIVLRGTYEAA